MTARTDLSAPREWKELGGEVVVARGEMVLPIVTKDTPEGRRVAMFLADTIEETCGKRPTVMTVAEGQRCEVEKGLFLLTAPRREGAPGTGKDGFRVVAKDGSVWFGGRTDYAVYDWCERALGMRYYCEGGKCVEKRDEIVVPSVDYSDAPVYEKRIISGNATWTKVAKCGTTHRGGVHVHAPHRWNKDAKLKAEHPEIFENGKTPMLCYGNPETLAVYKRRIDRHIAGLEDSGGIVDTNRQVVTVCQWDAPVNCKCKWCRTLYDYAGNKADKASPVLWGWFLPKLASWLREKHPEYEISFLPYWNSVGVPGVLAAPVGEDADGTVLGNCEAEVCTMPGLALLKDEKTRAREEGILRAWKEVTGRKVLSWDYGCWPLDYTSAPYVFGRTVQRHCADMRDVVAGVFVCGGDRDPRIALSMYVWAKCLWNPDIDVESVYDEFARRMFGVAAKPMRRLIALQEECWEREWDGTACSYENVFVRSFPKKDVETMRKLLNEAYRTAVEAGDETSAERVNWYAMGFERFVAEAQGIRDRGSGIRMGEMRMMVPARSVGTNVWAKTEVSWTAPRREGAPGTVLRFVVRCEEPAAGKMDFKEIDHDAVWGDDCVTFVFEGIGSFKVFKDGSVEEGVGGRCRCTNVGFNSAVRLDPSTAPHAWTVTAEVKVPAEIAKRGFVRGNVCRWRVGDVRKPKAERVPGSRYEHSRLGTVFTAPDDDPAAFVTFVF